jgi:hypothetical protein
MALPTSIRLGCKGLPDTKTLASYYEHLYTTTEKSFYDIGPRLKGFVILSSQILDWVENIYQKPTQQLILSRFIGRKNSLGHWLMIL